MLSEQERKAIDAERPLYEQDQAAAPEALKIIQAHRGWIDDQAVSDVAEALDMSFAEVEHLATSYSLIFRHPVGRHVILLCDGLTCWIMGYNALREALMERLQIGMGETTADGRFTLLPTACLGACDEAPLMMIDEDLHTYLTVDKLDEILERYE